MQFFISLKENATLNQFKDDIRPTIYNIIDLIIEYINTDGSNDSKDILVDLNKQLDIIISKLNALGYTYTPESNPDPNEEEFKNLLEKFKEELSYFYNNLSKEMLESFNTQVKYMSNLVDTHITNFIGEEIL